jgi:hypothetical protein
VHTKFIRNLVEKFKFESPRCTWEDKIEIGWESLDAIRLAEDREQWQVVLNRVMKFLVS